MVANLSALRTLRDHTKPVNSVDFTKDGEWLLSSGADCRVCLYSVQTGTLDRVVTCATGGATLTRFTHDHLSVLVSSTDHTIRYTSLHDNSYLRYFKGHTDAVVGMEMSPKDDCFATASIDRTARIWDLRTTNCQGIIPLSAGRPAVSFDNQGLVLAAAVDGGSVKLFDVRGYAKGPFTTFKIDGGGADGYGFSCVKFSNDGKLMLVGTTNARAIVLDAFEGHLRGSFTGHNNEQHLPLEARFVLDSSGFCRCLGLRISRGPRAYRVQRSSAPSPHASVPLPMGRSDAGELLRGRPVRPLWIGGRHGPPVAHTERPGASAATRCTHVARMRRQVQPDATDGRQRVLRAVPVGACARGGRLSAESTGVSAHS